MDANNSIILKDDNFLPAGINHGLCQKVAATKDLMRREFSYLLLVRLGSSLAIMESALI